MAAVSTYLNFAGNTEEAFNFYRAAFGTEFTALMRFGDMPAGEGQPEMSEEQKRMIVNIQLPTLGDHMLMGTDNLRFPLTDGNNMFICLMPDTREETDKLFDALSDGGDITTPLHAMFWGDYYGTLTDKFGIQWMFNCVAAGTDAA